MTANLILILCACVAIAALLCIAALFATVVISDSLFDELIEFVLTQPAG